mgnify:CR=1 FL=1
MARAARVGLSPVGGVTPANLQLTVGAEYEYVLMQGLSPVAGLQYGLNFGATDSLLFGVGARVFSEVSARRGLLEQACHGFPSGSPPDPDDGGYPALAERTGRRLLIEMCDVRLDLPSGRCMYEDTDKSVAPVDRMGRVIPPNDRVRVTPLGKYLDEPDAVIHPKAAA